MSTLLNIVKKKKAGEIKTINETTVYSELLGEDIKVVKRPISLYMDILSKHDVMVGEDVNFSGMIPMLNEIIFNFCPMFQEVDVVKEAREVYQVATPMELPEAVFESNIDEMSKILDAVNSMYNLEELEDDIKN